MSVITESSLILASSRVFCSRRVWLDSFPDKLLARAQERAQLLRRGVRHEAGAHQAISQQIRQPGGIVHIGLAARHVLDVRGVGQQQLELTIGQDVPDRLPVHPRRLHHDVGAIMAGKPFRHLQQFAGDRLECPNFPPRPAVHQQAYAGHHHILMHVQTSATRMQYLHGSLLAAVGVEPPLMNSNKRAPGRRHRPWRSRGCSGTPGPTRKRAETHQGHNRPLCRRRATD